MSRMEELSRYIIGLVKTGKMDKESAFQLLKGLNHHSSVEFDACVDKIIGELKLDDKLEILEVLKHITAEELVSRIKQNLKKKDEKAPNIWTVADKWPSFKTFVIDTPEVKELKIELQRDITINLHRTLPLCILLADPNLHPWYYEHFINIFSYTDNNGYLTLDYLEYWAPYRQVLNEVSLGSEFMAKETDIIAFIKQRISEGYYVSIAVDEYFLPGKKWYKNTHFIRHQLVYGYDDTGEKIEAVGLDSGEVVDRLTFNYETFSLAYEQSKQFYGSTPWTSRTVVQLFYSNVFNAPYPFSIKKFLVEMHNYIFSDGDDSIIYSWSMKKEQTTFGFKVYDEVVKHLENILIGKQTTDYRAIHLLAEHKKVMAKRLEYIITQYRINGKIPELFAEYLKVVNQFNEVRLKFFDIQYKYSINPDANSSEKMGMTIRQIIEGIPVIKEQERILMTEIYETLKSMFQIS